MATPTELNEAILRTLQTREQPPLPVPQRSPRRATGVTVIPVGPQMGMRPTTGTLKIPTIQPLNTTMRINPVIPRTSTPAVQPIAVIMPRNTVQQFVPQPITRTLVQPTAPQPFTFKPIVTAIPAMQPVGTVRISPPIRPIRVSPGSPANMTPEEEQEMQMAIMESMGIPITRPRIKVESPRNPYVSPVEPEMEKEENVDIEDQLLQEAIEASLLAGEQARTATFYANQLANSPSPFSSESSEELSPGIRNRQLREQQDFEYQEAERIDMERNETARKAAEAAEAAAKAAEEATRKLQEAKLAKQTMMNALQPPILDYPTEQAQPADLFMLRFQLPSGAYINHSFHRNEPLSSVQQQMRFDLKYIGDDDLILVMPPRTMLTCAPETPISGCGLSNKMVIRVEYPATAESPVIA